jgi:Domain of unknown function (DUF6647)
MRKMLFGVGMMLAPLAFASPSLTQLSLAGAVFGAIWSAPVLSHDIYSNLADKNGKLCCNKHDCRPAHFRVSPAGVSMLVEGSWLRVPDDLVVYRNLMGDRGETRGGHWCGATDWSRGGTGHNPYPLRVTYCAIVPPSFAFVPLSGPMEHATPATIAGSHDDTFGHLAFEGARHEPAGVGPSRFHRHGTAGTLPSPTLMTEIATWLSANFELPAVDELPGVEFASAAKLAVLRLGGVASSQSSTTEPNPPHPPLALYDSSKTTIYLPEGWSGETPAETSILVHEMVHYLQDVGGVKYACRDAREKPAYLAQDAWLRQFGQDLEATFEIDLFTVLVRSACFIELESGTPHRRR